MLDSGTSTPMLKNDEHLRRHCVDIDAGERTDGTSANSTFSTDGTATVGISIDFEEPDHTPARYNVTSRVTLCSDWHFDLWPPKWFQKLGHSVHFNGRQYLGDCSDGDTAFLLYQLSEGGKSFLGQVRLIEWSNLTFFAYHLFAPADDPVAATAGLDGSRGARCMLTAKYHVIFGHASMRRIRAMLTAVGVDVAGELPCMCPICSETASEMPCHRHFERQNADRSHVRGTPFQSADPELEAQVAEMNISEQNTPPSALEYDYGADELYSEEEFRQQDMAQIKLKASDSILMGTPDHELDHLVEDASFPDFGLSARRKSTRPGQIWHCDTIPLPTTAWDHKGVKRYRQSLILATTIPEKYLYMG